MSGSNNLPIDFDPGKGFGEIDKQVKQLGATFAAQMVPIANMNAALAQSQQRVLELRQASDLARTALDGVRDVMSRLGMAGGPLGEVGSALTQAAVAAKEAGEAARGGATGFGLLQPALLAVTAAVSAGVLVWQNWGSIVGLLRGNVQDLSSSFDGLNTKLGEIAQYFETAAEKAERLDRAARSAMAVGASSEGLRIAALRTDAQADLAEIDRTLARARAPGGIPLDAASAAAMERRRTELQAQITGYGAGISQAEAARQQALTGPAAWQRELLQNTIYEYRGNDARTTVFPVDAFPAPQRAGAGQVRPRTIYEDLGPGATVFPIDAVQGAMDKAREESARAEERAREAQARAEQRELDRRERANERTTDSIVKYAGDRFADLFSETGQGWAGLMESFRRTAISTFARIAAEAVIRPIIAPIVASTGLGGLMGGDGAGGTGSFGGLGSLLGLTNIIPGGASGLMDTLGLGGLGSGVGNFLASPILGSGALSSATNSALGAMGGLYGPATPSSLGLGGVTFGQALGGVGGGFALGSLVGGLVAGDSAARQTNSQIGAGGGAIAGAIIGSLIPGVGTVLGGLIGGGAGGGLGGLLGPGKGFSGGDALIGRTNDGFLTVTGYAGKGMDGGELTAEAQRQVEAINAQLRAANIRVTSGMRANMGGGGSPNPTTALGAIQQFGFGFGSDNARINAAIQPFGSNLEGALGVAQWITALEALTAALDTGIQPIRQITAQFEAAFENARKYGIGLEEVTRAQNAALGNLIAPTFSGLADTLAAERVGPNSPLNPRARAAAAQAEVSQLAARARSGDLTAYGRLQSATQTALAVNREVFGGGAAGVAGFNTILDKIEELIGGGAEALTAALFSAEIRSQTDSLTASIDRLRAEVTALRADMGQANRTPDRLR